MLLGHLWLEFVRGRPHPPPRASVLAAPKRRLQL